MNRHIICYVSEVEVKVMYQDIRKMNRLGLDCLGEAPDHCERLVRLSYSVFSP